MSIITVGRIRPYFRGDYTASAEYNFYDCARYAGTWWLHIGTAPTIGTAPSEGTVWTAFGIKGDPGPQGENGAAEHMSSYAVTAFDASGEPASITIGTATITITRDADRRLSAITDSSESGYIYRAQYDSDGRFTGLSKEAI